MEKLKEIAQQVCCISTFTIAILELWESRNKSYWEYQGIEGAVSIIMVAVACLLFSLIGLS